MLRKPRILGYRKNGAPIYEIKGASPDDASNNDGGGQDDGADDDADNDDGAGDDDGDDGDDKDDDKPLGEKGERALRAEKQRRKEAQRELRAYKNLGLTPEQIAELNRKGDRKSDGDDKDDGPDPEEVRRQAREEAAQEALQERVADKIEAKARAFADAEDAVAILLRTNDINDFIDDGKIDVDAITEALDDLGQNKPHLLAQGKRFQGSGDGGARRSKPKRPGSIGEAVTRKYANR